MCRAFVSLLVRRDRRMPTKCLRTFMGQIIDESQNTRKNSLPTMNACLKMERQRTDRRPFPLAPNALVASQLTADPPRAVEWGHRLDNHVLVFDKNRLPFVDAQTYDNFTFVDKPHHSVFAWKE